MMKEAEYVDLNGRHCPNEGCGGDTQRGDKDVMEGGGWITVNCWCDECKAEWYEEYELVSYTHH